MTDHRMVTPVVPPGKDPVPGVNAPEGWFDGHTLEQLREYLRFWQTPQSAAKAEELRRNHIGWYWLPDRHAHAAACRYEIKLREAAV